MPSFEEIQKARIANSFNLDEGLSELTKSEILDIEKGGKRAMIGEKRTFAGREYIKTADGWKFHGKGTGSAAQAHVAGALEHHVGEKKGVGSIKQGDTVKLKDDVHMASLSDFEGKPLKVVAVNTIEMASGPYNEILIEDADGKSRAIREDMLEAHKATPKPIKHKNATDHFVEVNGKHYIDTLDPDTGEKKFKPGDKVHYIDDNGDKHKGTISDREHEDGDMFEVDREEGESKPEFVVEGTLDPTKPDYKEKLKNTDWNKVDITNYQQRREFLGKMPNGKFGIKYFSPSGENSQIMELGETDYKRNLKQAQEQHSSSTHKSDKVGKVESVLSEEESAKLQSRMRSKLKESDEEK